MAWFRVDDGFADSKPVMRIPRRYRAAAIGLWTLAGAWSAKEMLDGFVPEFMVEEFGSTAAMAGHLVKAGLWVEVDGGWQFVGWAKYQPTRAEILAKRDAETERKRKYRAAKEARANGIDLKTIVDRPSSTYAQDDPTCGYVDQSEREEPKDSHDEEVHTLSQRDTHGTEVGLLAGHQVASAHPDPTRPGPAPSSSYVGREGYVSDARETPTPPTPPEPRCETHLHNPTTAACRGCGAARKVRADWDAAQALAAKLAHSAEAKARATALGASIAACPMCDDDGYVGRTLCDHNPDGTETARRGIALVRQALAGEAIA